MKTVSGNFSLTTQPEHFSISVTLGGNLFLLPVILQYSIPRYLPATVQQRAVRQRAHIAFLYPDILGQAYGEGDGGCLTGLDGLPFAHGDLQDWGFHIRL
jgi:hypothetical protein